MIDHDKNVETVLQKLDELGIAGDTIVMYGTDNGPHMNSCDAGMTPFRSEKNSNWEGAYRVPALVRWPGKIKPGTVFNEPMSHMDWLPTLVAAAGMPDIKERLLTGYKAGNKTYKVHLDGYNFLPCLTDQESKGPRTILFFRRRRPHGHTLRQLESCLRGAAGAGYAGGLVGAVHAAARPKNLQFADRTSHPIPTMIGCSITRSCLSPRNPMWQNFWRPLRQKAASFTVDQALEKLRQTSGD